MGGRRPTSLAIAPKNIGGLRPLPEWQLSRSGGASNVGGCSEMPPYDASIEMIQNANHAISRAQAPPESTDDLQISAHAVKNASRHYRGPSVGSFDGSL
jgi:hypothetical protein